MRVWGGVGRFWCPGCLPQSGKPARKDRFIPADQIIHLGDWEFADQTRTLPGIAHGILDCRDIMSVLANEKRALEIASSIAILENKPIGGVDINDSSNFIRMTPGITSSDGEAVDGIGDPPPPAYQTQKPLTPYQFKDNGEPLQVSKPSRLTSGLGG